MSNDFPEGAAHPHDNYMWSDDDDDVAVPGSWASEDNPALRILALKSMSIGPNILTQALDDEHPDVRAFAAQHPSMTYELLFHALSHKDAETRKAALKNPNIADEHLEFAQYDPEIAWEVAQLPAKQALTKNIGFVEFPKLGAQVVTHPMPMTRQDAVSRKMVMGDKLKVKSVDTDGPIDPDDIKVSGGKTFYSYNTNPAKGIPGKQRKMSGYVLNSKDGNQFKGRSDHEAQHTVFANIAQKHGIHAQHAAVEHVMSALSERDKSVLGMLNPQLKNYAESARNEEMIAYMQNFLQDPDRRKSALNNFAPNGKRLTESGQRKVHDMLKDMWKRMRNKAHEFGPEQVDAYKKRVMKADTQVIEIGAKLIKEIPGMGYNVVEDMSGSTLIDSKILKAIEFLSGKKCDMAKYRHAFWSTEDQYAAALMAVDMEPTDENKQSLKSIADLQEIKKNQADDTIKVVKQVFPSDMRVAQALQRGVDSLEVHTPELEGKHVGGIRTVKDPETQEVFLLKPGSGGASPARGVKEQIASPSEREVAFYEVAKALGMGERMVETYLMNIDGKYVAAMRMLPHNWTNLEKLKFQNRSLPASVLEKYRVTGELHTWGILDYILGNPDRHGQNLMVGPLDDNYPVVLIDHGSALAGPGFSPGDDEDSFIPYYFRAWNQKAFKNSLTPDKKIGLMPKTSDAGRTHIEEFIRKLNPAAIEGVLSRFGVDPTAIMSRVEKVKHLLSNGLALDEGVNKLWILGA